MKLRRPLQLAISFSLLAMALMGFATPARAQLNPGDIPAAAGTGLSLSVGSSTFVYSLLPASLSAPGGVEAINNVPHEWVSYLDTSGNLHLSQPAFSDISGTIGLSQLPSLFASAQAPSTPAFASAYWSSSTEYVTWWWLQSTGPASGAVAYYGVETSPDNSTWSSEQFTTGQVYTSPGFTSGNQYIRVRAYPLTITGASPTPSSWVTSSAQAYASSPYGGGGSGNPVVTAVFGGGSPYSLTQSYANSGVASVSLTAGNTYELRYIANLSETGPNSGPIDDDLRCFLQDATNGNMVPWSEQRQVPFILTGDSVRIEITGSCIYTPAGSGSVTVQLWPTNATAARGTLNVTTSRITAEQVSGSSSQAQQSTSFTPPSGCVGWWKPDTLGSGGSNISSWTDSSGSGNTMTCASNYPTVTALAWNGWSAATFGGSTNPLATSGLPSSSAVRDIFVVAKINSISTQTLFYEPSSSGGFKVVCGDAAGTGTAYTVEGIIAGVGYIGHQSSLTPQNGMVIMELSRTSGGTSNFYVNNVATTTSSSTPSTLSGTAEIGAANAGEVFEVLDFNTILSGANETLVYNYLNNKYGVNN